MLSYHTSLKQVRTGSQNRKTTTDIYQSRWKSNPSSFMKRKTSRSRSCTSGYPSSWMCAQITFALLRLVPGIYVKRECPSRKKQLKIFSISPLLSMRNVEIVPLSDVTDSYNLNKGSEQHEFVVRRREGNMFFTSIHREAINKVGDFDTKSTLALTSTVGHSCREGKAQGSPSAGYRSPWSILQHPSHPSSRRVPQC